MGHDPLAAQLVLDRIHCFDEGDGVGGAEPYLWTVHFKVDGETVHLGDDLYLHGRATVIPTPGSHGNLGDGEVSRGDDVWIPSAIGELCTTLRPIPMPRWVVELSGVENLAGVMGTVAVLMEEDWVSDSGAEAGHAALDAFVQQALDGLIPTLGIDRAGVDAHELQRLTAHAEDLIGRAIRSAESGWQSFVSWLNSDDEIGSQVFTFRHDELCEQGSRSFSHRFSDEGDWELHGHVTAVPTCPAEAAVRLMRDLGLSLDEAELRDMDAVQGFRRAQLAGNRALGGWWQLLERNTASVGHVLREDPEAARALVVPLSTGVAMGIHEPEAPLPSAMLAALEGLLALFVERGNRRLRIDAKAALNTLPRLRGQTMAGAVGVLAGAMPSRRPRART